MRHADLFVAACEAELQALKPGNVHVFADGHGMTVEVIHKVAEGYRPNVIDLMKRGEIALVFNTPEDGRARKVMRVQWSFAPHAAQAPAAGGARRGRDEEPQLPL